jgi:hypothetical protein
MFNQIISALISAFPSIANHLETPSEARRRDTANDKLPSFLRR